MYKKSNNTNFVLKDYFCFFIGFYRIINKALISIKLISKDI